MATLNLHLPTHNRALTLQNWVSRVSRIPGGFFEKLGGIPKILTSHREADRCAYQNLVFCMQYEIGDKDSWRLEMLIFGGGGGGYRLGV